MRYRVFVLSLGLLAGACSAQSANQPAPSSVTVFEGARLILGDGSPAIEDGAFIVEGNRFTAVGRRAEVAVPSGAARVDLTGKTVMPAVIDAHSHIGYMKDLTSGPQNYTREHILDHMHRFAYHGVAASMAMGTDFGEMPFQVRDEILAGKHPNAARFLSAGRGLAPLSELSSTNMRHAANPVSTPEGARALVGELAGRGVTMVKTWVDDRGGNNPDKMPPLLYQAIIDEAHRLNMRVAAHATGLQDTKDLLRAGLDVFAHMITDVDDELIALFRERPRTAVLLAQVGRRTIYAPYLDPIDPLLLETVTRAQVERLKGNIAKTSPEAMERARRSWDTTAQNIMKLHAAGVRIAIGSDGGGQGGDRFVGYTAHTELENMVAAGMTPAEAIVAGTKNGAEVLGLQDELGTLTAGKSADFIVLHRNPLEDIVNSRSFDRVYLRGHQVDRDGLREGWARGMSTN